MQTCGVQTFFLLTPFAVVFCIA